MNDRESSPPGPRTLPFVGGMLSFGKDPLSAVVELSRVYGGIVALGQMGRLPLFLVSAPDLIKHILQDNNKNYKKGRATQRLRSVLGDGLLLLEGDEWRRRRRLVQPAFHRNNIAEIGKAITDETQSALAQWTRGDGVIEIREEMLKLGMILTVRNLFKAEVSGRLRELAEAWQILFDDLSASRFAILRIPRSVPTRSNRRYMEARKTVDSVILELIADCRRSAQDNGSLLSLLVNARDEETGAGLTDRELRDEVMTLFVGGYETTSNALAFSFAMLSKHSAVERRHYQELCSVLTAAPAISDLQNLPYNRMVIEETMRLYPPSWLVAREAIADDVVGGHRIKRGSQLMISSYAAHHDSSSWPNPEGFDPERFTPENAGARPRFAYFPFGGGPRQCLGDQYALTEIQLIVATVARSFRLELLPGPPVAPRAMVGLRPMHPMRMFVRKRPLHS